MADFVGILLDVSANDLLNADGIETTPLLGPAALLDDEAEIMAANGVIPAPRLGPAALVDDETDIQAANGVQKTIGIIIGDANLYG